MLKKLMHIVFSLFICIFVLLGYILLPDVGASASFEILLEGTVEGKVGDSNLTESNVTITLSSYDAESFVNIPEDITSWFNLPDDSGLTANALLIDDCTISVSFEGTPTKEIVKQISVTVPCNYIDGYAEASVTSQPNTEAIYDIKNLSPLARFYQDNTVRGEVGDPLIQDCIYVEVLNVTVKPEIFNILDIDPEINNGLIAHITEVNDNVLTIVYSGIPNKEDKRDIDIILPKEIFIDELAEDLIVQQNDKTVKFYIGPKYEPSNPSSPNNSQEMPK